VTYAAALAVVGALVYAFSTNAKIQELGRILFFVALFWLVSEIAAHPLRFG